MDKLVLYIYGLNKDFKLDIKNDSQVAFDNYLELLSIFLDKKDDKFLLGTPIQMNGNIRKKYQDYVSKYKKESPLLNKFEKNLEKIKNNEFFWIDFKDSHSNEEILFIGNLVDVYNKSDDDEERAKLFQEISDIQDTVYGELLKVYDVKVFDSSIKKSIGESDRAKRICKFCKRNKQNDATFDSKAHIISEALGNKLLILNEECDECNSEFGSGIEIDLIEYLNVYRVFFKVKGKKNVPTVKYKKGGLIKNVSANEIPTNNLINTDNLMVIMSHDIKFDKETGSLNILLESQQKLKEVNIYKTLCKYVLSAISKEELPFLQETIDWIKSNDVEVKKLPYVAMTIVNKMFTEYPLLSIYIKKNDSQYPHVVAEFRFKSLIFVFILPFSTKNKINYQGKEVYSFLWKIFKHYDFVKTWNFYDFSSTEKKKYQFNINTIQNKMD